MKLRRLFGQRWLSALTLLAFVFLILAPASALPEGPTVIHGNIKVLTAGQLQQILQSSSQGIINWNSFGIAPNEVVRIIQPNASSVLLNRVTGMDPSVLQGLLQANGRIFLVNPNGILFGPNSKVDAGSFFATTLGISDQDFLKGNYNFSQNAQGQLAAIVNQGEIRVGDGGFIVLAAPLVHNDGLIVARQGSVNLAATQQATLQLDPQGSFQVIVPDGFKPTFSDPVKNGEAVLLQRGQVTDILSSVIKSGSVLEASSFEDGGASVIARNSSGLALNSGQIVVDGNPGQAAGRIRIDSERASVQSPTGILSAVGHNADAGDIRVVSNGASITAGAVDASATGTGHGGFVELSGRTLNFGSGVKVGSELGHAGTILLDPVDLIIVPGNFTGNLDGPFFANQTIANATTAFPLADTLADGSINSITSGNVILNATRDILYQTNTANISLPAAVNLAITAGRDITFQSTGATSMLGISAGNVSLEAGRDLTLQGRYGTLINATNGDARLTAGRNLNVQYFNPGGAGGSNPRRVMGLTATGNVNLTAGNNLVFAPNNNVDGLDGTPGFTTIRSTTGNIVVNAGQDASIGVGLSGTKDTKVGALGSLTITPVGISVAEASVFAGNLAIQGANVTINTNLTAAGNANINTTTGDLAIVHGAPNLTFGNTNLSAARNLTIQSTSPTGILNISSNSLNVTAANDLTIQGRYGVNLTSNTTANLNAGKDLSVQYYNPGPPGGSNPLRVMALSASGEINLTAGNNLVFATNNNVDGLAGVANITTVRSTSGNVFITAGQDASLSVGLNTTRNASIVAGRNLTITPMNISVAEVSPNMTGNLSLQASNVTIGTDITSNTTNITSTVGDLQIVHGSPTLTVGNLSLNSARNLTIQANAPTGLVNISTKSLSLTASNELTLQGRSGVNLTSSGPANLTAGRNLTVQYYNPGFAGGSNPLRVMALTATGDINLSAGNNLVFTTNNNVDGLNGGTPNATTIRSTSGNIVVAAGQDASIGVSLNSTTNANVVANGNLTVSPLSISVAEASPNMAGNLNLQASNVILNTDLTVNGTANITTTAGDLAIVHGNPRLTVGNLSLNSARNLTIQATAPTGLVNISTNVLNLTAGNDLLIQGRNGVNMTSNTTADLTANRNLSVQYYNPIFAGGSNPLRVMALTATGDINLSAGNNLVFSTNNNIDGLNGGTPNATTIRSTSGNIVVAAGQDASIGVSLNSTTNANVVAIGNLTVTPSNVSVAEVSPNMAGNLNLQASNVILNTDLTVNGTANITTTAGDLAIVHGTPRLTVGNLSLNSARNLTIQATAPTGMVNISANVLNLNSGNDLSIQGRYGVNLTSNTTADLNAGRNLSIQYYNPIFAGGSSPRRVMALTATGDINLSAGNSLVFATNNNIDSPDGVPNTTTINSQTGSIAINAGQDASIGVGLNSTKNASVVAGRNLSINPASISVAEASPTMAGNLNLQASNVIVNTDLTVNGTANITTTAGDLAIVHGTPRLTVGNLSLNSARNLTIQATAPTGMVNISTNVLNLNAGNDLSIQGRYGVNLTSNTTADLTAGRNLSIQYYNPIFAGGSSPRRVMALTATGDINLSAGNSLVFATNNNIDSPDGVPNTTTINSQTGSIAINAGQDASIGVGLNSTKNASVVAGRNLSINPASISVAEASPTMAGNLNLQASNVIVNTDLTVNGTANITTTAGDLAIVHGTPRLTVGNLSLNSARNLTIQATAPTGMVNISTNVLNLNAGNDLSIQGRYGVNMTSNTTADLTAGRNLSVQYFNPVFAGGSNPRRVMALTAASDISLTAGNNLVFATNNNIDGLDGTPNTTTINSQTASIAINAGQDVFLGVSTNSSVNDNIIAGDTIHVGATGISGPEATTNTSGNLSLAANALNISATTPLSAQGALTLNISSGLNLTSDLNSAQGLTLISNTSITGNGRNVTSSNGVVNLTVFGNGNLTFNNSNISGSNGVALQNLGNGTATITASNLTSSQGVQAITTGNGGMTIDGSSLNSTSSNVSLRNSGAGPVVLSNSSVSAPNIDVLNSGNGSVSVVNTSFGATNNVIAQNPGGGSLSFIGGNISAGQSFNLNSSGPGQVQFNNSTLNTTTGGLLNLGNGTFNVTNSTLSVTNNLALRNQAGGSLSFTGGNLSVGQAFNLDSNGSGAVQFGNSTVNASGGNLQNFGGGSLNVTNSTFSITNTLDLRNQGGGNFQVTGGNLSVGQPFTLSSNGGSFQFNNSSVNSSAIDVQNSGGGNFSSQGSRFVSGSTVKFQNQDGTLNLTAANVDAAGGVVLNSTSPASSTITGSNVRAGTTFNLTSTTGGWNLGGSNFNSVGAISLASQGGAAINVVDSNITTNNGSIDIKSAGTSDIILGNSTRLVSNNGNITVDSGRNLLAGPASSLRSGNVTLKAAGNLTVGILNASNAAINSTGGNIVVESMSLINGGNISFYTPLGLLENTPVSPTAILTPLQSLTLDVGTAFGNATLTSTFSVVNSSTIDILITAPNDPTRARAADLKTFGGAKPLVRRITNTGAIFLDGVELFVNPIVQQQSVAITRREELDDSLQVELIRQLAQCNLALGNKSGTAYFVDSEDRLQIPYNSDLLSGPFSDYPMAITLEHIVELDPKSLLEKAKLDLAVARATNVMNSQEEQEAWEIRYWTHFIERIILWGDDE